MLLINKIMTMKDILYKINGTQYHVNLYRVCKENKEHLITQEVDGEILKQTVILGNFSRGIRISHFYNRQINPQTGARLFVKVLSHIGENLLFGTDFYSPIWENSPVWERISEIDRAPLLIIGPYVLKLLDGAGMYASQSSQPGI